MGRLVSSMKLQITQRYIVRASHELILSQSNVSEKKHGHLYEFLITISGQTDIQTGQLTDRAILNSSIKEYFQQIDHTDLSNRFLPPTGEIICKSVYDDIKKTYPDLGLIQVTLIETAKNKFKFPS